MNHWVRNINNLGCWHRDPSAEPVCLGFVACTQWSSWQCILCIVWSLWVQRVTISGGAGVSVTLDIHLPPLIELIECCMGSSSTIPLLYHLMFYQFSCSIIYLWQFCSCRLTCVVLCYCSSSHLLWSNKVWNSNSSLQPFLSHVWCHIFQTRESGHAPCKRRSWSLPRSSSSFPGRLIPWSSPVCLMSFWRPVSRFLLHHNEVCVYSSSFCCCFCLLHHRITWITVRICIGWHILWKGWHTREFVRPMLNWIWAGLGWTGL